MAEVKTSSRSGSHFRRFAPLYISILILAVIGFGMWGYILITRTQKANAFSILYDTILMFKMESYEPGMINWQLIVARYLAALIVGYGVYILVIDHLRKWWARLKIILFYRKHTIIAGLGLKGYLLAKDMKKHKEKVVVIENNPDSIFIQRICKDGVIVFISDGQDKRCWLNAGLLRARRFILVMDSDDKNIEATTLIAELCKKRKAKNPLIGLIHVDNLQNYDVLKDYLDIQFGTSRIDFNIFNTHKLAAQRMWDQYPPHNNLEDPLGSKLSILISGYNETAEAFLVENMMLSHYRDLKNIHVLMVVNDAKKISEELDKKYPFMEKFIDIDVIEQPDHFFHRENMVEDPERKLISDEDFMNLSHVYVFGDDDAEVFLRAMKIKQCFYNRSCSMENNILEKIDFDKAMRQPEFIVCLPEKTDIIGLLGYYPENNETLSKDDPEKSGESSTVKKLENNFNIVFFRRFTDSFNNSYLIVQNDLNTVLGKVINYLFEIKYNFYNDLEELFKHSKNSFKGVTEEEFKNELAEILFNFKFNKEKLTEKNFGENILEQIEDAVLSDMKEKFKLPAGFPLREFEINHRWQQLTDRLEDSNICAARHMKIKLLYPHREKKDYTILAPMEHKRWWAEKLAFQFRYGLVPPGETVFEFRPVLIPEGESLKKIIKEQLKLNALIIPFEEIPAAEREKDYDLFRITGLLEQIINIMNSKSKSASW